MLHELIDVCNADHIIWGCDSATADESYSAKLAMMDVLADVLTERVEAGVMREKSAERYAQMLLHDNGAKLIYR